MNETDKGSTESEDSTDEERDSLVQQDLDSEYDELTREEKLMQMAILQNFLGRNRRKINGVAHTS